MREAQEQVRSFHKLMGLPAPDSPVLPSSEGERKLRISLINEEAREFSEACGWDEEYGIFVHDPNPVEMLDALSDLMYVTIGAAVAFGVDLEPFFEAVHGSNLLKVNGPVRPDGKILKPEGWTPPDIRGVYMNLYGDLEGAS